MPTLDVPLDALRKGEAAWILGISQEESVTRQANSAFDQAVSSRQWGWILAWEPAEPHVPTVRLQSPARAHWSQQRKYRHRDNYCCKASILCRILEGSRAGPRCIGAQDRPILWLGKNGSVDICQYFHKTMTECSVVWDQGGQWSSRSRSVIQFWLLNHITWQNRPPFRGTPHLQIVHPKHFISVSLLPHFANIHSSW